MFFDFHTHNPQIGKNGIYNLRIGIDQSVPAEVQYFTAGIHPWDVERISIYQAIEQLKEFLQREDCLGIGEVGLDKICGTNLDLQKDVLNKQIELAENSSKKVLIIHCVKAFQEIIFAKKASDAQLKWVIHGFNGSKDLINSLINAGFYLSVGDSIMRSNSKISESLPGINMDRLFLESDESNHRISNLYHSAAKMLNLDVSELSNQILRNLYTLFPNLKE